MEPLILVIEKDKQFLDLSKELLELYGYVVLPAETIDEGICYLQDLNTQIQAVLLDLKLYKTDFNNNIPALRKINPFVKIIGMSGNLSTNDLPKSLSEQLICVLQKPFTIEQLLSELCSVSVSQKVFGEAKI
jgi:two-component system cell cycle sensor histidine kinase/response regulator CckA